MGKTSDRAIKCEGRFKELREFLFEEVLPIVQKEPFKITREELDDAWDLVADDVAYFDLRDPYYCSKLDQLRKAPKKDPLSFVPLIDSSIHLDPPIVKDYATSMGVADHTAHFLDEMTTQPRHFLSRTLGREPASIWLPGDGNLAKYRVSANFGIGSICEGGVGGGGIRSDSPFLIEVYEQPHRGEFNLAAVLGFWPQDNEMLVSQMQSCRNGKFPPGVPFGIGCLQVGETVARQMGFENVKLYSGKNHPIFNEHPESRGQLEKDFVCIWDGSAKKLDYDGTRGSHYEKRI